MALGHSVFEAPGRPHLPLGPIEGPSVWTGAEMGWRSDWIHTLSGAEVAEIDAALAVARRRGTPLAEIGPEDFPLRWLAPVLRRLRAAILEGRGFVLLRGLPADRYDLEELAAIYIGIGRHLGAIRSQNAQGHLLGHVCDLGHSQDNPEQRGYRAAGPLGFHTDSVDIVALLCWRPARRGGESRIASSATVYNEVLRRRPDLVPALFGDIYRDRRGEIPDGKPPWWVMPVFQWYEGRLFSHFSTTYIRSAQRFNQAPRLTEAQLEMLDLVPAIAGEASVHLEMQLRPGDIQFLNNHRILHGRAAYDDWPDEDRRRYLLRLWICPPDGPPLPPSYADRYGGITVGDRGGIVVPGMVPTVSMAPI